VSATVAEKCGEHVGGGRFRRFPHGVGAIATSSTSPTTALPDRIGSISAAD